MQADMAQVIWQYISGVELTLVGMVIIVHNWIVTHLHVQECIFIADSCSS